VKGILLGFVGEDEADPPHLRAETLIIIAPCPLQMVFNGFFGKVLSASNS